MKTSLKQVILLAACIMLSSWAGSAESSDNITAPTIKDLQGRWEGHSRVDKYRVTTTSYYTFSGNNATYSSERGGYKAKVNIKGEEIIIESADGKITDTCKLSKTADKLILNCSFDVAKYGAKDSYSGTRRLEKSK